MQLRRRRAGQQLRCAALEVGAHALERSERHGRHACRRARVAHAAHRGVRAWESPSRLLRAEVLTHALALVRLRLHPAALVARVVVALQAQHGAGLEPRRVGASLRRHLLVARPARGRQLRPRLRQQREGVQQRKLLRAPPGLARHARRPLRHRAQHRLEVHRLAAGLGTEDAPRAGCAGMRGVTGHRHVSTHATSARTPLLARALLQASQPCALARSPRLLSLRCRVRCRNAACSGHRGRCDARAARAHLPGAPLSPAPAMRAAAWLMGRDRAS